MQLALLSTKNVLKYTSFFDSSIPKDIKNLASWMDIQGEARTTVYDMDGHTFRLNPVRGQSGGRYYLTKMSYVSRNVVADDFYRTAIAYEGVGEESTRRGYNNTFLADIGPSWAEGFGIKFGVAEINSVYLVPDRVRKLGTQVSISLPAVNIRSFTSSMTWNSGTTITMDAYVSGEGRTTAAVNAYSKKYEVQWGVYQNFTMDPVIKVETTNLRNIAFLNAVRSTSYPDIVGGTVDKRTASMPALGEDETVDLSWGALVVATGSNDLIAYIFDRNDYTLPDGLVPGDVAQGTFADTVPLIRVPGAMYTL